MAKIEFPFKYGTVHLYDELKHLALQEKIKLDQKNYNLPENCETILNTSMQMERVLKEASIKRSAWYSFESVAAFFGVTNALRKSGFLGKVLAFFLSPSSYFKFFK